MSTDTFTVTTIDDGRDEVLETFTILRERLKNGVDRVLEIDRKHPHYVAALIIAAGCEAVGHLLQSVDGRMREDHEVFVSAIVAPHRPGWILSPKARRGDPSMGRDLFEALRHGVAHLFDTKFLKIDDQRRIELVVKWENGNEHLGLRRDPPGIYLSLPTMRRDFVAMLNRYREEIQAASRPGRRLSDYWCHRLLEEADDKKGWIAFLQDEKGDLDRYGASGGQSPG